MSIPSIIDSISERVAKKTFRFVQTRFGKLFLGLALIGPLTFIPTVYMAWTAPNIDSLRTLTWPLMTVVNISVLLGAMHNGDWRIRLVFFIWVLAMVAVYVATLVR